jgi:branched-subunit amino acid aminotransferase/4-amino-4-deoxychorismate lyase
MEFVFHRGEYILRNQATIQVDDRAHRFGDGFFESIRIANGKAQFLKNHFGRIAASIQVLKMKSDSFDFDKLEKDIAGLLQRNEIHEGGRMRITFYRKSKGFYLPKEHDLDYFIEVEAIPNNLFELNPNGKTIDIYTEVKKDPNRFANFKTLNAQLYIMASIFADEKNWDDALIQNTKLAIIEATASNLFLVSNGVLYTPSLTDGCVGGTMRMTIINLALQNKLKVYECTINPQNLLTADEVFLTNAIRGVEWVASYRTKPYQNQIAQRFIDLLNQSLI